MAADNSMDSEVDYSLATQAGRTAQCRHGSGLCGQGGRGASPVQHHAAGRGSPAEVVCGGELRQSGNAGAGDKRGQGACSVRPFRATLFQLP